MKPTIIYNKNVKNRLRILIIFLFLSTFQLIKAQQIVKLNINPQMVTSESNCGNPGLLFDEQVLAGDPKNGSGGSISNQNTWNNFVNTWECGYGSTIVYPDYAYVDLGNIYTITDIYLRDVNGNGEFSVYKGCPGQWEYLFNDYCYGYNSWNAHIVNNISTRFLRFKKSSDGAIISELVIYGYASVTLNNDTILPAAITDLKVDSTTTSGAYLSWKAPGDDQDTGIASNYDLRYNIMPITAANYNSSMIATNVVSPKAAGTTQHFYCDGLQSGTTYYFAIKTRDEKFNISEISNVAKGLIKHVLYCPSYRIIITPEMLLNEFAVGDATKIVDEQDIVNNPINGSGGICTSSWDYNSNNQVQPWHFPISVLIDLGTTYTITNSCIFNAGYNPGILKIYYSDEPFINKDSIDLNFSNINKWNCANNQYKDKTRYIRIVINSANLILGEISFYGYPSLPFVAEQNYQTTATNYPLLNEFIGVNCFNNEPIGRLNCAGFLREYHNWQWDEGNNSSYANQYNTHEIEWNVEGGYFNFDVFYQNMKTQGIGVSPAIQNNVPWLISYNNFYIESKPLDTPGSDALSPSSYTNHANFIYQMGARYGNSQHLDNELLLASGQNHYSGMKWVNYYENWNEQNKWWSGRASYFSPYEYAAMSSADYDGHEGVLNLNGFSIGLKNADTNSKLVMGGIAEGTMDYFKAIRLWSQYKRSDKKVPLDVLNTHYYFYKLQNGSPVAISPEEFGIKDKMKELINYKNKYMPEKEVWLSEFGYNTTANTWYSVPVIGSCSREEVQARWLVRSFLELAAAGVDKAIAYKLSDENDTTSTGNTYCSSGITYSNLMNYQPKTAWYYIYSLKNRLKDFKFKEEIASANANVKIYSFVDNNSHYKVYALWCPTSTDLNYGQYTLNLDASLTNAKLVKLENGSVNGIDSILQINQHKVIVNVSEKPVFVIASTDTVFPKIPNQEHKIILNSSMVINELNKGDATLLVDEQQMSGDPLNGINGNPTTNWQPTYHDQEYPISVYIDLGTEMDISKVYLYDSFGSGNITISAGTPGNWTPLYTELLDQYMTWRGRTVNVNTRYIRVTHLDGANMNEIILYAK